MIRTGTQVLCGFFLDGLREELPHPYLVIEFSYCCGVFGMNVAALYVMHRASLRSVFDVGKPTRATGQIPYQVCNTALFCSNGLEAVRVKSVFMLRVCDVCGCWFYWVLQEFVFVQ